jgi:hypothetical protein
VAGAGIGTAFMEMLTMRPMHAFLCAYAHQCGGGVARQNLMGFSMTLIVKAPR